MRLIPLAALLLLVACRPMRMAAPPELAQAETLDLTDRSSDSFRFGPYRAHDKQGGWNESGRATWGDILDGKNPSMKGTYSFKFTTPRGQAEGLCDSERSTQEVDAPIVGTLTSTNARVDCRCRGEGLTASGYLEGGSGGEWTGRLNVHGEGYHVLSTAKFEGGTLVDANEPTGYLVRGPQTLVAGIETMKPGRVWLARTLDDASRGEIACLLAGLLFYNRPDDT